VEPRFKTRKSPRKRPVALLIYPLAFLVKMDLLRAPYNAEQTDGNTASTQTYTMNQADASEDKWLVGESSVSGHTGGPDETVDEEEVVDRKADRDKAAPSIDNGPVESFDGHEVGSRANGPWSQAAQNRGRGDDRAESELDVIRRKAGARKLAPTTFLDEDRD
jgi:hypothetical protein